MSKIFLILIFFVAGIAIAGPMDDAERHFIKKEYSFAQWTMLKGISSKKNILLQ